MQARLVLDAQLADRLSQSIHNFQADLIGVPLK